jgi:Tol biopolymer transport system component
MTQDGEKIAFIGKRVGTQKQELWQKSLKDGRETLLAVKEHPLFALRWSRDGTILAYRLPTWIVPGLAKVEPSTVTIPAGGGDEQKLTSGRGDGELPFDWSADGQWVLATSGLDQGRLSALVLLPVTSAPHAETAARVITSNSERTLFQARFSPDDEWICFNGISNGNSTIYVVRTSGGEWTRITEEVGWADKPRWSPDGKTIYFVSTRDTSFLNVWARGFDPLEGKPVGEPFRVTSYESPNPTIWSSPSMQISLSEKRLVLPIMNVTGSIWMLENVAR